MSCMTWNKVNQLPSEHQAATVQHVDLAPIGMDLKALRELPRFLPMETEQLIFDSPGAAHILGHFDTTERTIGQKSVAVMEPIAKGFISEQDLYVRWLQGFPAR